MAVATFEQLIAWQKARELRKAIYRASANEPFSLDFEMRRQIRSAALSVMSNIAEGFERDHAREFVYFLRVARASCGEVRSQLYAAFDEGYLSESVLRRLLDVANEVGRIVRGLENSLPTTRH